MRSGTPVVRGNGLWAGNVIVASAVFLAAACIDFIEPDLAERDAPAILSATVRVEDGQNVSVDARLAPGLDRNGFRRGLLRDRLRVNGMDVAPDTVLRNGTRIYDRALAFTTSPTAMRIEAPLVDDVSGPAAVVQWPVVRRAGTDAVVLAPGADLVLTLDTAASAPDPPPAVRQWTLQIRGDADENFTVGATGAPPDSIVVPRRWIPRGSQVGALLVYQQSTLLRPTPGDYIGLITLDTRVSWTVRLRP